MTKEDLKKAIIDLQHNLKAQMTEAQRAGDEARIRSYQLDGGIAALGELWLTFDKAETEKPRAKAKRQPSQISDPQ